jgi:predicted membrane protein
MVFKMKTRHIVEGILWGVYLIAAAVILVLNQFLGYFSFVGLFELAAVLVLAPIVVSSLVKIEFFWAFLSAGIFAVIFKSRLEILEEKAWILFGVAALVGLGFNLIFMGLRRKVWKHGHHYCFNHSSVHEITSDADVQVEASFSENNQRISSQGLKSVYVKCSFGSCNLFFNDATLAPEGASLVLECSFGGVELYIPKHWNVTIKASAAFGGISEKNRCEPDNTQTLTITGNVSFGGVTIIYI